MEDVNDFASNGNCLEILVEDYMVLTIQKEDYEKKLEEYNNLLKTENTNKNQLSFKERLEIYNIINNLINSYNKDSNSNLYTIRKRLLETNSDISNYLNIKESLNTINKNIDRLLTEKVDFRLFKKVRSSNRCYNKHYLIKIGDELKCVCCGATTKNYDLTKYEFNILELAAKKQGLLLENVTEDDLALIEVLLERNDYYRSIYQPKEDLGPIVSSEEEWLDYEMEIPEIKGDIKQAHFHDDQVTEYEDYFIFDPKYLSDVKASELLSNVHEEYQRVINSDSKYKDLFIEECKVAKYEILILNGKHIPTLFEEAHTEEDKIALIKAYYNLSNVMYRTHCDYFSNSDNQVMAAAYYDYITANKEINSRILDMKVRR